MRKPLGILGSIAQNCQRNATMTAGKCMYELLTGEKYKPRRRTKNPKKS